MIKVPKKLSERREEIIPQIGERLKEAIISNALDGIRRLPEPDESFDIRPRIHQVCASGNYLYRSIESSFPGRIQIDGGYSAEDEKRDYETKLYIKLPDCPNVTITVFLNPGSEFKKYTWVEISPGETDIREHKRALRQMAVKLPKLKVARVEYATDQFCKTYKDVERLFDEERRFVFAKNAQFKKTHLVGGQDGDGKEGRMNRVYRFPKGKNKLYERGPDLKRIGIAWPIEECDKVRLEHTAGRNELRKHKLTYLSDLVKNPRFCEINDNLYHFCHFEEPSENGNLPKAWESYDSPDSEGKSDAFLAEHQRYRKEPKYEKTLRRYTVSTADFNDLLEYMKNKWLQFDGDWKAL